MKILQNIYYNAKHPACFAGARQIIKGVKELNRSNKPSEKNIHSWLNSQDAHNLHRMTRYRFNRRSYNVQHIDDVWEADLVDLRALSSYNNGMTYLLVVIDVLSKFVWAEPLKDKSSSCVANAFTNILNRSEGRIPYYVQSDRGREFTGSTFQTLLEQNEIKFRTVRNPDVKAAIVERFNRTLKERIWRYFTYSRSKRYIDVLQNIIYAYNHTKHSGTKMAPTDINEINSDEAFSNLQKRHQANIVRKHRQAHKAKYNCGDLVRISSAKATFTKGYKSHWSKEIFKVRYVSHYRLPVVYLLTDLNGDEIDGIFYAEELSKVNHSIKKSNDIA